MNTGSNTKEMKHYCSVLSPKFELNLIKLHLVDSWTFIQFICLSAWILQSKHIEVINIYFEKVDLSYASLPCNILFPDLSLSLIVMQMVTLQFSDQRCNMGKSGDRALHNCFQLFNNLKVHWSRRLEYCAVV